MSNPPVQDDVKGKTMSKKEQFMAFILVGAIARDIRGDSNDSQLIMHIAGQIPEDSIPVNIMNAAKVYLAFCDDAGKRPHRWMLTPVKERLKAES
jgi:hypothetical protein